MQDGDHDLIEYDDEEDSGEELADILGNKVMDFEDGDEKPIKPSMLCDKLDDVIKFVKTKYHNKKYKDEFELLREARNQMYRERCMKALGKWKEDLINNS